jgi:CDP-diacylglycerol--glycerol-3-phosphate 3-phosphatidyltransferase
VKDKLLNINIPNALTIFRIVLIPVFVLVFYLPGDSSHIFCAVIFFVAAVTDWLDGYLARVLDQGTPFGAFLDPVADKLMVATALVLLVEQQDDSLFTVAAMVIIGREIVISALREWMAELGKSASVAVSFVGKAKTLAQMAAIFALLLAGPQMPGYVLQVGYVLLYASAALTLWSMAVYLSAAINEFEG